MKNSVKLFLSAVAGLNCNVYSFAAMVEQPVDFNPQGNSLEQHAEESDIEFWGEENFQNDFGGDEFDDSDFDEYSDEEISKWYDDFASILEQGDDASQEEVTVPQEGNAEDEVPLSGEVLTTGLTYPAMAR